MRVALVITKLAGLRGGAERIVVELAQALVERGHDVTLVTYELSSEAPGYDRGPVPLVNLFPRSLGRVLTWRPSRPSEVERVVAGRGNGRITGQLKWRMTHGWFARRLSRWLRDHPHDVVVGFLPPAISAVAFASDRLGSDRPRVIASTHNVPDEDFGPHGRWDPNPVTRRNNLRALELADVVTVLQPEFVDQLPPGARPNAVVLPNPVRRLTPPRPGAVREDVILGVGRLTNVKRFDVLVRAFALVADDLPGWRVEIHGEGPERRRLELLVSELELQDRVRLAGVTHDLATVYDSAKVLVHPAQYEGFGLVVAEAIMHGLDVVAFANCAGVNRLVEDGATGVLVEDRGDAAGEIADGVRRLVTSPPQHDVREAARRALARRLAPEPIVDEWQRLMIG